MHGGKIICFVVRNFHALSAQQLRYPLTHPLHICVEGEEVERAKSSASQPHRRYRFLQFEHKVAKTEKWIRTILSFQVD